jgi:membrane-bound ClpP family serine protease
LTIDGPIDSVTMRSLERRLAVAIAQGADAIVLEIDTPGGELGATLEITHLIRSQMPSNTVAWIHPHAFSAGTIIALACREIVVSPYATFGDSAPITPFGPIPTTERAKVEAPLLAEVIDSARRNHWDENLVQAFVSVGVELWLLQHVTDGRRVFVSRSEYREVFGEEPPQDFIPVQASDVSSTNETAISPLFDLMRLAENASGVSPATTIDTEVEIAFAQTLPPSRGRLTADERLQWRLIGQVTAEDRLLTLKPLEAHAFGLASATIADDAQLQSFFGAATLQKYHRSWSESLTRFLISWPVRGTLIVIFLLGLFLESAIPGTTVFGGLSAAALLVLLGAPMVAGMAQWWDIVLVVVGLGLVAAELFIIPGTGIAGVVGIGAVMVGMVGTFVSGDLGADESQTQMLTGILTVLISAVIAGGIIGFLWRWVDTSRIGRRLILTSAVSNPAMTHLPASDHHDDVAMGDTGVATASLRPSGRIRIGEHVIDASSTGRWIQEGRPVRVVGIGLTVEVEEIKK